MVDRPMRAGLRFGVLLLAMLGGCNSEPASRGESSTTSVDMGSVQATAVAATVVAAASYSDPARNAGRN